MFTKKKNYFCPLIREDCKKHECVMWKNKECTIIKFMEELSTNETVSEIEMDIPLDKKTKLMYPPWLIDKVKHVENKYEEIKLADSNKLAAEIVSLAKEMNPDKDIEWIDIFVLQKFWANKKLDTRYPDDEILRSKIIEVESIARLRYKEEIYENREKRFKKERDELPSLVDSCANWAIEQGITKMTIPDISTFLADNNIDIMPEIKRFLYTKVNKELRSRK